MNCDTLRGAAELVDAIVFVDVLSPRERAMLTDSDLLPTTTPAKTGERLPDGAGARSSAVCDVHSGGSGALVAGQYVELACSLAEHRKQLLSRALRKVEGRPGLVAGGARPGTAVRRAVAEEKTAAGVKLQAGEPSAQLSRALAAAPATIVSSSRLEQRPDELWADETPAGEPPGGDGSPRHEEPQAEKRPRKAVLRGGDRRVYPRRGSDSEVVLCRIPTGSRLPPQRVAWLLHSSRLKGKLRDVSLSGLALLVNEELEAGTSLLARIFNRQANASVDTAGEVLRCTAVGDGTWQVVCRLDRHLSFDEVNLVGQHLFHSTIV